MILTLLQLQTFHAHQQALKYYVELWAMTGLEMLLIASSMLHADKNPPHLQLPCDRDGRLVRP